MPNAAKIPRIPKRIQRIADYCRLGGRRFISLIRCFRAEKPSVDTGSSRAVALRRQTAPRKLSLVGLWCRAETASLAMRTRRRLGLRDVRQAEVSAEAGRA